jgi:hypothetical protein
MVRWVLADVGRPNQCSGGVSNGPDKSCVRKHPDCDRHLRYDPAFAQPEELFLVNIGKRAAGTALVTLVVSLASCGSASKGSSDIKGAPAQASSKLAERVSAAYYALMPSPAAGWV